MENVKIVGSSGFYEAICLKCGDVLGSGSERSVLPSICLRCTVRRNDTLKK